MAEPAVDSEEAEPERKRRPELAAVEDRKDPGGRVPEAPARRHRARIRWRSVLRLAGRPLLRLALLVVLPLVAVYHGAAWWAGTLRYVETENAYVKANVLAVSADVSGRVSAVGVAENQRVARGDMLLTIDPRPFEIAVAGAEAELGEVRAEIEATRAEYRAMQVEAVETEQMVAYMNQEHERQRTLSQRGVTTAARLDKAQNDLEMARRELNTRRERTRMMLAELGGDPGIRVEQHPKYLRALAELEARRLDVERTTVRAPAGGVVGNVDLQPGEYVQAGTPLFSLIESEAPWIEANLKETQLTHVRVGQRATFVADAYPEVTFEAVVESISPATGAEFALLPPQNASGNWVKVVQRLPVRLRILPQPGQPPLRAGMTVTLTIDTERERSLRLVVDGWLEDTPLEGWLPTSLLPAE